MALASLLRHSIGRNRWYGNINPLSIGYAFQPDLRSRLTQSGRTLPLETLGFRRTGFSPVFSLLTPAFSLLSAPAYLTVYLHRTKYAPLPIGLLPIPQFRYYA